MSAAVVLRGAPLPSLYQGGEHLRWGYFGCLLSDLQLGDAWKRLFRKLRVDGRVVADDPRPGVRLRGLDGLRGGKAVSVPFDEWAAGSLQGLVVPSLEVTRDSAGVKLRECVIVRGRSSQSYEVELDADMMFVGGWMRTVDGRVDISADRAARWVSFALASVRRYPLDVVE
jgi:hypothetical protein